MAYLAGMTEITMTLETITPETAKEYLYLNHVNRRMQQNTVNFYARQMKDNLWRLNGDAIRFAETSALLDGQHRLMAVLDCGVPLTTWVARGLPSESQLTMDQQRKRTAGDLLSMLGVARGNQIAAIARFIRRWDQGERSLRGFSGGQRPISNAEVVAIVQTSDIYSDAAIAVSVRGLLGQAPPRALGALWVLVARTDRQYADSFFQFLASGADLSEGNPILTLRRFWANLATPNTRRGGANTALFIMAGVRAWNAWVEGRGLATISYKSGDIPEVLAPGPGVRRAGAVNSLISSTPVSSRRRRHESSEVAYT